MENQIVAHPDQPLLAQQDLQQRAGARGFHAGFRQHIRQRRARPGPACSKAPLDGGAGLLLVLLQHQLVAGQPHVFAFHRDLFLLRQHRVDQERRRIRQFAAAQILFGDAGQQRVLLVKLAHRAAAASRAPDWNQARSANQGWGCCKRDHRRARRRRRDLALRQAGARHQFGHAHAVFRFAHQQRDALGRGRFRQRAQPLAATRSSLAIPLAADIHHHAAADGHHRRKHADDEAVSGQQQRRLPQHDARPAALARLQRGGAVQQPHLRLDLRRARMEMHRRAMLQRLGRRQELQRAIDLRDGPKHPRRGQHHAARQFRRFDVGQIQRGALPGQRLLGGLRRRPARRARAAAGRSGTVRLPAPCATVPEISVPVTTVPKPFTVKARSSGRRKCPAALFSGAARGGALQLPAQIVEPRAGHGTDRHHRRAFQKRTRHELLHLQPHQFQDVRVHQVGLGERHHAMRDSQQAADIEVLARLRLDGFVGRDDEQHQVDAAHAGQHVLDEALVPGHVHEAQPQLGASIAGARNRYRW